jgi:hypothetical protein
MDCLRLSRMKCVALRIQFVVSQKLFAKSEMRKLLHKVACEAILEVSLLEKSEWMYGEEWDESG